MVFFNGNLLDARSNRLLVTEQVNDRRHPISIYGKGRLAFKRPHDRYNSIDDNSKNVIKRSIER